MFDSFLDLATIDASMFILHEIANRNGANWDWDTGQGTEIRYTREDSPQVVACLQAIVKSKRRLGKSVKRDKAILDRAMEELRAYFPTVSRDKQIEILKLVND